MIKNSLRNFFKNLKYVFTPFGVLFLFVLIGLSIGIPLMLNAIKTAFEECKVALEQASFDWEGGLSSIFESVSGLGWGSDPGKAFNTMFSSDFITSTLYTAIQKIFGEGSKSVQGVIDAVTKCGGTILLAAILIIVFIVLGLIVGYLFTRAFIRGEITKGKWWKVLLMVLLDTTVNLALFIGVIALMSVWRASIFLSIILAMLIYSVVSLFEAYLIYGIKKVKFKKVFHPLNFLYIVLSDLIIVVATVIIILPFFILMNPIAAFFIAVSLVEISFIVGSLNSESYVIKCVNDEANPQIEKKEETPKEETKKE